MAQAALAKGGLRFVCLALTALLCACASPRQDAEALGQRHRLSASIVAAGPFNLYSMAPTSWAADQPLTIYIEGDGYAFVTPRRLSDDPTPRHPLVLGLAVQDPSPNVVYIARPCQYVAGPDRRNCHPAFWSVARYGEDVMDAMGAAVDHYLRLSGAKRLVLYGYSGGGAIAALLAARRDDVDRLVTIAGVLDTDAWTDLDSSTPLAHSFNPADFADRLAAVPQIHLVGKDDTRVPVQVAAAFVRHFPVGHRPPIRIMPGYNHDCCWVEHWPEILPELFHELF